MLSLIAAVARNRAIGNDGRLLWHLPEDMRHFRQSTSGKTVIMGRKTWESLPPAFRPLPQRNNIVVSHNPGYAADGARVAISLDDAIALAGDEDEVFVIGGGTLYRQTLPLAERLYLTEVAVDGIGDTFFPEVSPAEWREVSRRAGSNGENGPVYAFVVYERRRDRGGR